MDCNVNHLAWVENVKVICPRPSTRLEVCQERIINIILSWALTAQKPQSLPKLRPVQYF